MSNRLKSEFATLGEGQMRSNIERIITSYREPWDLYVELIQNSTDAIIDQFTFENISKGIISLDINTEERRIKIVDNGCGISPEYLSKILVTGNSLKRESNTGKYGFMGFGLTFVAFQSSYIQITTVKDGKKAQLTYKNLYKFVYEGEDIPRSEEEKQNIGDILDSDQDNGTIIEVVFPLNFQEEFIEHNLSHAFLSAVHENVLKTILRTRSAVGLVETIFNPNFENFKFSLIVNSKNIEIDNKYLTIHEIVDTQYPHENRKYKLTGVEYQTILTMSANMPLNTQIQTRHAVILYDTISNLTVGLINPLQLRLYICATSKEKLNSFSESLCPLDENMFNIENGIWLSIDGLPTGVRLENFEHGSYLPFTVIADVQDPRIRKELDAGRKGITPTRKYQIIEIVKEQLRLSGFIRHRSSIIGAANRVNNPLNDSRQSLINKLNYKVLEDVSLVQPLFPPIEEQEVIGLFIELLAKDFIKGYKIKVLSGFEIYDGLGEYDISINDDIIHSSDNPLGVHRDIFNRYGDRLQKSNIVIEFKQTLDGLYNDIARGLKDLNEIDLLICWSVDYENSDRYNREYGDFLNRKNTSNNIYYGVTHELTTTQRGSSSLPIIELKTIINTLFNINV